jgi:hypothetical protein
MRSAAEIDRDVDSALIKLYEKTPAARNSPRCEGSSSFGHYQGRFHYRRTIRGRALRIEGKTAGYYNTAAASYGLQAGAQSFGYALFFITDKALDYLKTSEGWEIGVGPSIVIVDEGAATSLTTTTAKSDIYAFFFDQRGLMAGLGLQGSKISKIEKQ